jgi:hypothetical protein
MTFTEPRAKNDCPCRSRQQFTQIELNHSLLCWLPDGFLLSLLFNPEDGDNYAPPKHWLSVAYTVLYPIR